MNFNDDKENYHVKQMDLNCAIHPSARKSNDDLNWNEDLLQMIQFINKLKMMF
jgi:hypothetical protein